MLSQHPLTIWSVIGATFLCLFAMAEQGQQVWAQEFKIDTQVYVGNDKQPIGQHLTLFSDGMIFDFQMSNEAQPKPVEIVIFNSRDKSFNLLDMNRSIRLPLQQVQIVQMVDGLRQQTLQDESMRFLVEDKYVEDFDISSGWVALTSDFIDYRFKGEKPSDVTILPLYFEFIENYSRLNASDPKKLPPFARMRLNQSIRKFGLMPSRIDVTLKKNGLFKEQVTMRSEHTVNMNLSDKDKQRIKDAKSSWMTFKAVNLSKYRGLTRQSRLALIPKKANELVPKTETNSQTEPVPTSQASDKK